MLTLILMRHAKSSWDAPNLSDHDRQLNARGRASANAMGNWLRQRGFLPEEVLCSSSRRTRETFAGLGMDARVHFLRELYHASPAAMLHVLRGAEAQSVLLIGHNPGIASFAASIVATPPRHPRFGDYPTCSTLVARFNLDHWSDVDWRLGETVDFAIPREVIAEGN